jgi:O-glycosyl hydrolase
VQRPMTGSLRQQARAALGLAMLTLAACGSDRGVADGIAGGYDGGGIIGLTGGCYANQNPAVPNDGAAVIRVDPSTRYQTMQGFGTSVRLFDDPHVTETFDQTTKRASAVPSESAQNQILDALYGDLGLTRVRFFPGDLGLVEPVNDNADPLVADLSKFDFAWKKSDGQIDMVPGLIRRGVTTYYGSTLSLEKWMTEANPEEYAEWVIVMLRHWRDKGAEMPYFSLKNEPGFAPSGGVWSGEYLRSVTKILGARIKAEGLKTKLVLPDDVSPNEAYGRLQIILADPEARQYVGAIAYHLYQRGGEDKIKQLGAQYGIPIWMTEFSTGDDWLEWAKIMHDLIANDGVSAVDYMWGYFGDYDKSQLVRLVVRNGSFERFSLTPQYYVTGQYSRYVKPGAVRVGATSSDPNVLATAYVDGTKLIVVATYAPPPAVFFERLVRVELGTGGPCVKRVEGFRSGLSDAWLALQPLNIDVPRFSMTLPVRTVTTFVGQQ